MNDLSQRGSAVEIIAEALDVYDEPYARMVERPGAGDVAAQLLATWEKHQRTEPINECDYATGPMLGEVLAALNAHGLDTYEERCAEIGKRLVDSVRAYIFSVHSLRDADAGEQLAAQRYGERMKELSRRIA